MRAGARRHQNARNEGLFTPQTLTREQLSAPGEFGGSNWGGAAGDPTTGWLYVRTTDTPALHKLRVPGVWVPAFSSGVGNTPAARGRAVYQNYCEACHGQPTANGIHAYGASALINVAALGADRIKTIVRAGAGAMPAHSEAMINAEQMDWLLTYLNDPTAANAGPPYQCNPKRRRRPNPTLPFIGASPAIPARSDRCFTPAMGCRHETAMGVARGYDLNEGVVKWQVPLGIVARSRRKGSKHRQLRARVSQRHRRDRGD